MTKEKNYDKTKKAYKEIISIINKYKDVCVYDIKELERKSKCHLFGLELKEKYGLNVNPEETNSLDYIRFDDFRWIGWMGEKYRRTISWSDDGKQPEDELMFVIGFSTGAYIFGDDYPKELFQKFFLELKVYKPKYTDTTNNNLYFSIDRAKEIFNNFEEILIKYRKINTENYKKREIKRLKERITNLSK